MDDLTPAQLKELIRVQMGVMELVAQHLTLGQPSGEAILFIILGTCKKIGRLLDIPPTQSQYSRLVEEARDFFSDGLTGH